MAYFNLREQFDVTILSFDVLVTDLTTFRKIGDFFNLLVTLTAAAYFQTY
jgi:hypothetical protein